MDKQTKKSFDEFFEKSKKYNGFRNNASFCELFEWLASPNQVYRMIEACRFSRSALEGVIVELEQKFSNRNDLELNNNFIKQMIGRAIKDILNEFGYVQTVQKKLPKAKFFTSATHYEYNVDPDKGGIRQTKELVMEPRIKLLNPD